MKRLILITAVLFTTVFLFAQDTYNSDYDYFVEYTAKLNKTQKRLTYMNKKSAMAKVGTETINGIISGTLFYDVKIKGMGAVVTLCYTDFCDEEGWIYNGEIITTSNLAQNGTLGGSITVTGTEPATVYYDKVELKGGKPGNGTYGVQKPGKDRTEVPYTYYFKAE